MRQYGGIGVPDDVFREAAEVMMELDHDRRIEGVDNPQRRLPPDEYYQDLLDAALRSIWPGTGPIEVKEIKVSVA